jgi:hypothetical protein
VRIPVISVKARKSDRRDPRTTTLPAGGQRALMMLLAEIVGSAISATGPGA